MFGNAMDAVGLVVSAAVLVYLIYTLIFPEKF